MLPPASFYRLADIKTSWAKAVDYYEVTWEQLPLLRDRRGEDEGCRLSGQGLNPIPWEHTTALSSAIFLGATWAHNFASWFISLPLRPEKQSNRVVTPHDNQNLTPAQNAENFHLHFLCIIWEPVICREILLSISGITDSSNAAWPVLWNVNVTKAAESRQILFPFHRLGNRFRV